MILLKSALGGLFIGLVLWLSQTRLSYLAGLLLFFPIISVPTFLFMGSGDADKMRDAIIWSFWSIPVWVCFALALYFCSFKLKIIPSIAVSLVVWFLGATLLVLLRSKL